VFIIAKSSMNCLVRPQPDHSFKVDGMCHESNDGISVSLKLVSVGF